MLVCVCGVCVVYVCVCVCVGVCVCVCVWCMCVGVWCGCTGECDYSPRELTISRTILKFAVSPILSLKQEQINFCISVLIKTFGNCIL